MTAEPSSLADQALANLVHQFARPLDFLRELAQNAIDAGSPRVEVSVAYEPPAAGEALGVLRISVDDWGEGMDEAIIDGQLTRLFSSSKEDDLTKIGKFGIGFTSIFAIAPEAVLLRTGRHGERWELLFHPDRSFDKVRIDAPVDGTKISLFKRMPPDAIERFVDECRFVLTYWCEHSDVTITFRDLTVGEDAPTPVTDDPFAAFAAPRQDLGAVVVNRPLAIDDAHLTLRHAEGPIEVVVGYADTPRYAWYNGGLTLLATASPDALARWAPYLRRASLKVKHDRLEHTLTRDNVIHDEHWEEAIAVVLRARTRLQDALLDRLEADVDAGDREAVRRWHAILAAECGAPDGDLLRERLSGRRLARDHLGRPLTLDRIAEQERAVGSVLLATGRSPLHDALDALGMTLVDDLPETRQLLLALDPAPPVAVFGRSARKLERADEAFVLPSPVPPSALTPEERRLLERTSALLRAAVGLRVRVPLSATGLAADRVIQLTPGEGSVANRLGLLVGDFPATDDVLALDGPRDGRIFQRHGQPRIRLPAFLQWRTLLVNRRHPLFRAHLLASGEDLELAAFGLAQALLHVEGIEGERAYRQMLEVVAAEAS